MRKTIISLILLSGFVAPAVRAAEEPALKADRPDRYTVQQGDTLWSISKKFLKDPWKWPQLWGMNREQVKNPHLIYPGDVLELAVTAEGARLQVGPAKLSPRIRVEKTARTAIPSIPPHLIEPLLSQPLVVEADQLAAAPQIVAGPDSRVIVGAGDIAYAKGLDARQGELWQVYRHGPPLVDPDTQEVLGYEAFYLGEARVLRFGEVSKLEILKSTQEIHRENRLTPSPGLQFITYMPHAPSKKIDGRIISAYGGVAEAAQNSIVALNRGARDGLERGHIVVVRHDGEVVKVGGPLVHRPGYAPPAEQVQVPGEEVALLFVFRVFDRVAYALVVESKRQITNGDHFYTP